MKRLERAQARMGGYSLLRPLGESEVSSNYLAQLEDDSGAAKYCQIKVVRPDLAVDDGFAVAFREACVVAEQLEHPHLVRVFDHGEQDGDFFVVTEFVSGTTLRALQDGLKAEGKQLPLPCVISIGLVVASALHRLEAGVGDLSLVHGELRLDRIVVSSTGDIKLADFCVEDALRRVRNETVLRLDSDRARAETRCGHLSVEQLLGDKIDGRTDQYALGAVMYELVAGAAPYERRDFPSTVAAVIGGSRPDLRQVMPQMPEAFAGIIDRALSRRADERYLSPAALYADLERLSAGLDLTSAVGLLAGLARGMEPVIPLEPSEAAGPAPSPNEPPPLPSQRIPLPPPQQMPPPPPHMPPPQQMPPEYVSGVMPPSSDDDRYSAGPGRPH